MPVTLLDRVSLLTATTTNKVDKSASPQRASYYIEVTTAATTNATWDVSLRVLSPDGTAIQVASGAIDVGDAAGVPTLLTQATTFGAGDETKDPLPFPDSVLYTETSAGSSFTGDVFVIWS